MKNKTDFNIVICGVGGQGLITLLRILAEAALIENYDVRTSELHGLSQRGGSVEVHLRFGTRVYSPLVLSGKADLVLGLEILETLKRIDYANKNTVFLVNEKYISFAGSPSKEEIIKKLKNFFDKIHFIPASEICQKELNKEVLAGIYLLGFASFQKLMPPRPDSILKAIKKIIPQKYLAINKKAFNLALK